MRGITIIGVGVFLFGANTARAQIDAESINDIDGSVIFVTQTLVTGELGGLEGADDICRNEAADNELAGDWVAVMTNRGQPLSERVAFQDNIYNTHGDLIDSDGDITRFDRAIRFTASGRRATRRIARTGLVNRAGRAFNCHNWTRRRGLSVTAGVFRRRAPLAGGAANCNRLLPILCARAESLPLVAGPRERLITARLTSRGRRIVPDTISVVRGATALETRVDAEGLVQFVVPRYFFSVSVSVVADGETFFGTLYSSWVPDRGDAVVQLQRDSVVNGGI